MLKENGIKCDSGTRVILSHDEKIEINDKVLIADNGILTIGNFTESTNVDSVVGKVKEMCHYM